MTRKFVSFTIFIDFFLEIFQLRTRTLPAITKVANHGKLATKVALKHFKFQFPS